MEAVAEFRASYQLDQCGAWREIAQDPVAFRRSVMEVQQELAQLPQVETPVRHYFADGLYAREMTIPAGTAVIGKIHRFEHISVVSKGEIVVFTEHGVKRVSAPCTMVSPPGTKRAVIALTETIWTTFHPTESRDIAEIESQVIIPDYDSSEFEALMRQACPGALLQQA